jgi:hypothetical protein
MAGGGQDRACALGWGEVIHPNRPKTVARYPTVHVPALVATMVGRHLAHPEKRIEGEQARNLIEAEAHDAE